MKIGCTERVTQVRKRGHGAGDSELSPCVHASHEFPGDSCFLVQGPSDSDTLKPCKGPILQLSVECEKCLLFSGGEELMLNGHHGNMVVLSHASSAHWLNTATCLGSTTKTTHIF